MAAPTTTEEALAQAALGPQSVTVDGNNVTQRSLDEIRRQDQYEASKRAASAGQGLFGMRTRIGVPPEGGR